VIIQPDVLPVLRRPQAHPSDIHAEAPEHRLVHPRRLAALVQVATRLPAYRLLLSLPGVGPSLAAILLAELGDIAWYTQFSQLRKLAGLDIAPLESGQWAGTPRISRCGRPLLRWALYQAALGAARTARGHAWRTALIAKRQGDCHAFVKANVELAAKLLRRV
jgi:transposase